MKRTALLFIIAIYTLSCLGVAVNSVYCCGRLLSTTVLQAAQKADCKMVSKMPGCCKTKKQYLKLKDQHFGSTAFNFNARLFSLVSIIYPTFNINASGFKPIYTVFNNHAPPGWPKAPVYILNCTYRI